MHELLVMSGYQVDLTFNNEDDLISLFTIGLHGGAGEILSREHPDYEFISEADLAGVEEVSEAGDKLIENLVDQLSLHLRSQLLVQVILFNDQVIILSERLVYGILNALGQVRWHIVGLVTSLNSLHPQVHTIQPDIKKIIEGSL